MLLQHAFDCGTGDVVVPARASLVDSPRPPPGAAAPARCRAAAGTSSVPTPEDPSRRVHGLRRSARKLQEATKVCRSSRLRRFASRTARQLAHPGRIGRERLSTQQLGRILRFHLEGAKLLGGAAIAASARRPAGPAASMNSSARAREASPGSRASRKSRNSWVVNALETERAQVGAENSSQAGRARGLLEPAQQ